MRQERSRRFDDSEDFNVWPAFTDLMSNAFMILSFLLLLAIIKPLVSIASLRATEEALRQQLLGTQTSLDAERQRAAAAEGQLGALATQTQALQLKFQAEAATPKAPPIIVIQDTGVYRFESGSAALPQALDTYVRTQLLPQIEANAQQFKIDVVEVIGHTDGQPNNTGASNLDRTVEKVAAGETPVSQLVPGSNADLGLMRSLAVVQILQKIQKKEARLRGLEFRAYSAAQLISPTGNFAQLNGSADESRRRIEIRFTRLGKVTSVQ